MTTALAVLASYVLMRIVVRDRLFTIYHNALDCVQEMDNLVKTHGSTVGDLMSAGVKDRYDELWDEGGKLYRRAVPLAAFLMYWPVGPLFLKNKLLAAYDEVGLFSGRMGSYNTWEDLRRGYARNTKYYPQAHLLGNLNAIKFAFKIP